MATTKSKYRGALYYPYIHIHDLDWLRANLLIFPRVERMLPMNFTPLDDAGVREFTQEWRPKGGKAQPALLLPADIFNDRVRNAQRMLASKFELDLQDKEFLKRYGKKAARKLIPQNDPGFQIHAQKLTRELRETLTNGNKLAWEPVNSEPYDKNQNHGYVEVHPRVGEAVMSTLAIACAQGDALDIVVDQRSGKLHECLLEQDLDNVYNAWLNSRINMPPPKPAKPGELFEFILGIPGVNLKELTVEKLHELRKDREAIDDLIAKLREKAADIPRMDDGERREEAFKDTATDALNEWKRDRVNLRGFARELFGLDKTSKLATDFASKVADKTLTGLAAGTTGAAIAGGWHGALAAGGIIGAGAGLVIGFIAHAGLTLHTVIDREKKSPYRFLTTLEDTGVVFRSELVTVHKK